MGRERRWPAAGSGWDRASRSRRAFVLALLLLAVVGIGISLSGHGGWWNVVAPTCVLVGLFTMLLTPAVDNQRGRP